MKKDSRVLLGVPSQFEHPGFDEYIGFNAGRVYGTIQLSHLFANWEQGIKICKLNVFHISILTNRLIIHK